MKRFGASAQPLLSALDMSALDMFAVCARYVCGSYVLGATGFPGEIEMAICFLLICNIGFPQRVINNSSSLTIHIGHEHLKHI